MTTARQLKRIFSEGYDSGNVLRRVPNRRRRHEERLIGGSYRRLFTQAVLPHLLENSTVMELGPGRGSWTRALLQSVPRGRVHTLDYFDVTQWLDMDSYGGRLVCDQVEDNSFSAAPDGEFDLFFSFGALCHNTTAAIGEIMTNALPKLKPGGVGVHQYGDWAKLDRLGWDEEKHGVPAGYRDLADDHEWNLWPRNDPDTMASVCTEAGWVLERADLGLFERDSVIRLRAPN